MKRSTPKLCTICGSTFASREDRIAHVEAAHPGLAMAWIGRAPAIRQADGTVVPVPPAEYQRMRRAALARGVGPSAVGGDGGSGEIGHSGDDPAPVNPPERDSIVPPTADGPKRRPSVMQPPVRVSQAAKAATMADAVREAMTVDMLADMLRHLSVVISEWDGAGPEGEFSAIQAKQIAMLLHDSTVDIVVRRFGGDVSRFKLAFALAIVAVSKGRVHVRAIAAKRAEARIAALAVPVTPGEDEAPELEPEPEPEPVPEPPLDPIARLAALQSKGARNA